MDIQDTSPLVQVQVHGVFPDPNTETQIVILRNEEQSEILPIWVGAAEGHAIELALKEVTPPRPMTHDLIHNLMTQFHTRIARVLVTDVKESTYFASVVLRNKETERMVDARPSDAIALALRANAPIFITHDILKSRSVGSLDAWLEKFESKDTGKLQT